jgi:hypothetical protein
MIVGPGGQEEVCFDKKNKYLILCWMHVKPSKLHILFSEFVLCSLL